jgi:hypothetical protein
VNIPDDLPDKVFRYTKSQHQFEEPYQLGAFLVSIGAFLIASSIPDLWKILSPSVDLSNQLLRQEELKAHARSLKESGSDGETDSGEDRQGVGEAAKGEN